MDNDLLVVKVHKRSKNLYAFGIGSNVTQNFVLEHIGRGGVVRALDCKRNDVTSDFLKKLLKHVNLNTTEAYAALRAGWERKCEITMSLN